MIQSLDRGLVILSILAEKRSMSITELAAELEVNKSTASRLIDTLKYHDMVYLDKRNKKYRLGYRILYLSEVLKDNLHIISIANPFLQKLSDTLCESVHFCYYNNGGVYVMDQVRSHKRYSLSASIGMVEPLHASAVGKCILAYRREEVLFNMLENYEFEKYTEKTIMDKESLLQNLAEIKDCGYALDNEEVFIGVKCIAVPVFDYGNNVHYSIGVSGPKDCISSETIEKYYKHMKRTAREISKAIGCVRKW